MGFNKRFDKNGLAGESVSLQITDLIYSYNNLNLCVG